MAKVYVSSTVADLKPERQAVIDWLVAAGHQPVHSYRPDSETVQDSCLNDISPCDLYVLILGHRYGFEPKDGNPNCLSITHLEFRRAAESHVPRVALLRMSVPDIGLSDLRDSVQAGKLFTFIEEVRREVRPAEFSDLAGLLSALSTGVQQELERLAARSKLHASDVSFLPGDRVEHTRRYKEVSDLISLLFQPISSGLRKDTAIWRGIMRDKDRQDAIEYRMAYELEMKQVIPNHKEIVSVIDKWRHLVHSDAELCDLLDEYLRHVAVFIAIRDAGETWKFPELLGYPWPQKLIPAIETRLATLRDEKFELERALGASY